MNVQGIKILVCPFVVIAFVHRESANLEIFAAVSFIRQNLDKTTVFLLLSKGHNY